MGTIVVGYVPKPEGKAALRRAAEEARLRNARLVVVNSHRGGREFDTDDAIESEAQLEEVRAELRDAGVEHEVPDADGSAPAPDEAEDPAEAPL
ncbi:universal stress protein [Klebsiella pneumoniae]|uniref:universal stress protein n=1 Tax=Klebsiella pneumoniae TaxID=573 RepID=UPI003A864EEC